MAVVPSALPRSRRRRWTYLAIGAIAAVAILALVLVPARVQAERVSVSPGSPAAASFTFTGPTYVTIHFSSWGGYGMRYWMSGAAGLMYNHSMMSGGMMRGASDTYSFWTWGGQYTCGAAFTTTGAGATPVWINASSAYL